MHDRLASEIAYAARRGTQLSLLLLDIDHFKRINDQYGHAAGDTALCALANLLDGLARREDILARFGGEEFALIARGIGRSGARALAERARTAVERHRVRVDSAVIAFTVSIGVAQFEPAEGNAAQRLFEAADRALYAAKDAGRNRVVTAS